MRSLSLKRSVISALGLSAIMISGLAAPLAVAADNTTSKVPADVAPDNSKVNKRDRHPNELTADQQTSNKADVELIRNIRRSLTADNSLSVNAQNVKIISQSGRVILKGPVKNADEKATVERIASDIVGRDRIASELSVTNQ